MKKQKVSLKKLKLAKSKVAQLNTDTIVGGGSFFCLTDNGCGPQKSVWPDICPISHNCPPATSDCPNPQTTDCISIVACQSTFCITIVAC